MVDEVIKASLMSYIKIGGNENDREKNSKSS